MGIQEKDLQGFKYLSGLFGTLKTFHTVEDHHLRKLHYDEYISLLLFYFFNPILTSLRGIQQASMLGPHWGQAPRCFKKGGDHYFSDVLEGEMYRS
ncbi:MAG: hypothetical protein JW896_18715 [Deltaproteobacteria bacterium]|nr:hypothetical protein [Deltaproteobacteria bacterium]